MKSSALVVICLVMGCESAPTPAASSASKPADAAQPQTGPAATGRTVELDAREPETPIHPGDRVLLRLGNSSMGVSPEYRHGWGEMTVTGDALAFVSHTTESPPPDVDGGRAIEVFELRATAEGEATIAVPVRNPGVESGARDFEMTVNVTAAK